MTRTAILLPYYNYPTGLARTLESLRGEDQPFDLYIVDDGSRPSLELDTSQYPFPVHVVSLTQNNGIEGALNAGLTQIFSGSYEYIARIDTGDLWLPGRLAAQADYLDRRPDYVLVGSWVAAFDDNGKDRFVVRYPKTNRAVWKYMAMNSAFCHPAVMVRADAWREVGVYAKDFPAAEDYELFFRLLLRGKGGNLPQVWLRYEVSANAPSISYQKRRRQLLSRLKVQLKYFSSASPWAWWGVARTVLLLAIPYDWVLLLKSRLWRRKASS